MVDGVLCSLNELYLHTKCLLGNTPAKTVLDACRFCGDGCAYEEFGLKYFREFYSGKSRKP